MEVTPPLSMLVDSASNQPEIAVGASVHTVEQRPSSELGSTNPVLGAECAPCATRFGNRTVRSDTDDASAITSPRIAAAGRVVDHSNSGRIGGAYRVG